MTYTWTDNPTEVGVALANPDVLNENLMHLKYSNGLQTVTCSTASDVSTKEITLTDADFTNDFMFFAKFDNANTARPQRGTDLKVTFSDGTANDDFGLYTVTTIGSPTYTDNKFNSNGTTGLSYPITSLGTGAWCILQKFKSTNTTTQQFLNSTIQPFGLYLQKTTANKLALSVSSNGSSWNVANVSVGSKSDWSVSTEYYTRTRFDGSRYYVDWSSDYNPSTGAGTWINDITVNSSTIIYSNLSGIIFGINYANLAPLIGTMDDIYVTVGSSTIIEATELSLKANSGTAYPIYNLKGNLVKSSMFSNSANEEVLFKWDSANFRYVLITAPFWQAKVNSPSGIKISYALSNNTWRTETAPADGFIHTMGGTSSTASRVLRCRAYDGTNYRDAMIYCYTSGQELFTTPIRIKKGETMYFYALADNNLFGVFEYAEGSKP